MLAAAQAVVVNDTDSLSRRDAVCRTKERHISPAPRDDAAATAADAKAMCLTLRRGPQLMVVFRGCPRRSVVLSLRQAQVMIGLALSPAELTMTRPLDDYSYVFVSSRSQAASALAYAASDLIRAKWSIDDNTTWPMVARSGRSVTTDDHLAPVVPAPVHHACSDAVDQYPDDCLVGLLWRGMRHAAVSERWQARWRSLLQPRRIHRD